MLILITGSAGFIGSELCLKLLLSGKKVIGIDNHNLYYDPQIKENRLARYLNHPNYKHHRIDLNNKAAIDDIFKKYKPCKVVNLAAQAGVRYSIKNPTSYIESNIFGFMNILENCRNHKVEHLVYASYFKCIWRKYKMPFSET